MLCLRCKSQPTLHQSGILDTVPRSADSRTREQLRRGTLTASTSERCRSHTHVTRIVVVYFDARLGIDPYGLQGLCPMTAHTIRITSAAAASVPAITQRGQL